MSMGAARWSWRVDITVWAARCNHDMAGYEVPFADIPKPRVGPGWSAAISLPDEEAKEGVD